MFTQRLGAWMGFFLLMAGPALAQESAKKTTTLTRKTGSDPVLNTTKARKMTRPFVRPNQTVWVGKDQGGTKAPGDTLYYEGFAFTQWPAASTGLLQLNLDGKAPGNNPGQTINTTTFGNNAWVSLVAPTTYAQGGRIAASISWTTQSGPVNRWLVTPPIAITEAGYKFRWKARASNPDFPDGYVVKVCTNCPDPVTNANVESAFSTTLFSIDEEDTLRNFVTREVNLSQYAGQTIRLAIQNNSNDMDRLYVDDLLVYRTPPIDVSAGRIFSPNSAIYDCAKTNFPVVVSFFNGGAQEATNVKIKVQSTGPISDSSIVTLNSLAAESGDTIALDSGLNLSAPGNYQIRYTISAAGDASTTNNSALVTFRTPQAQSGNLAFDFEDLTADDPLPMDWISTSFFLPVDEAGGFNNSVGLLIPVFNNLQNRTERENSIITPKFTGVPATAQLTLKYRISTLTTADYQFIAGDSVIVQVFKNCQPAGEAFVLSDANQTANADYAKLFIPLAPFNLTPSDEISVEIRAVASATTPVFALNIDDFILGDVADGDIALTSIERPTNTIFKKNQISSFVVKGSVFNEGSTTVAPIIVNVTANPSPATAADTISSLVGGFSKPFSTTPGISLTETGEYTIAATASVPGVTDPNPADNAADFNLTVSDSTMAKDLGEPVNTTGLGYGPTSGGKRIMANAITTTARDTCTSVSVYVGLIDTDVAVKSFVGTPNAAGTGWVEDSSSTLVTIPVDQSNSWVTLRHRSSIGNVATRARGRAIAPNSTNLYGVKIRGGNLRILFNFENIADDGSWIWLGGNWLGTQDLTIGAVTFFMRPNFGRPATLVSASQLEKSLQFADIVPNPSNGEAQLSMAINKGTDLSINVLTLDGRSLRTSNALVATGVNRVDLPTKGLSKGMYLVRIQAEGYNVVKKMVIE